MWVEPREPPSRGAGRAGTEGETPLRVLHLLPDLAIGGGQSIVLQHLRHFDRGRYEVGLASLLDQDQLAPRFAAAGVEPMFLHHRPGMTPRTVDRLARLVRSRQIDVLHVHSGPDRKLGQLAALLTGVPVVASLHSEWVHLGVRYSEGATALQTLNAQVAGRSRDWIEHRTVGHYVAVSAAVAARFAPLVTRPITVLRQSVAIDEIDAAVGTDAGRHKRQELGVDCTAPVLLNVSRLVAGKGHGDLVSMHARVVERHPDAVLVIAGDGDRRQEVEACIADCGLTDHVRLLGDRFDVPELAAMADVFVFASETEGFGLALLEAMGASLPVVAYALPAFAEFAENGVTADLVPVGDVAGLASRVAALLDDRDRARQLGRAGRAVVEASFPADAVARHFEHVYDTVVADASRRR